MTSGQTVRFGPVRRGEHRLKRSRSQYMSTPHLNYTSNWQLNQLNANLRKSHNSVHINMNGPSKAHTNRHIASAHKLIDGLNEEEVTFKSRLRGVLNSYNFQLAMVTLVILDCIMVLGEMIIEMQLNNKECTEMSAHIEDAFEKVTQMNISQYAADNFTEQPESAQLMEASESEQHSIFSSCHYGHLLHQLEKYFHLTSIFILFSFNVELLSRLYAFGYKYFLHWEIALDALIVIVSFSLDVAFLDSGLKKYLYLLIILRLWRVLRIIHAIMTAIKTPFERQIEKLKKKRKILQRDLAKAYFYSNMLEEEIKNLRRYVEELEAARKQQEEEEEDEEEEEKVQEDQQCDADKSTGKG